MDVRLRVKSVEPTKFPAGRETVEGDTLNTKSELCGVPEAVVIDEVVDEVV
jgi:hypothetical protein